VLPKGDLGGVEDLEREESLELKGGNLGVWESFMDFLAWAATIWFLRKGVTASIF
jgi:hypothetical protein